MVAVVESAFAEGSKLAVCRITHALSAPMCLAPYQPMDLLTPSHETSLRLCPRDPKQRCFCDAAR